MLKYSFHFFIILFGTSICIWGQNNNLRVETLFEPATITLSNSSIYKIIIHGSQESPVGSVPSVSGLQFSKTPRTFRSASFINGIPAVRFELSFEVKPQREGTFKLPAWNLRVGKQTCQAPSTTLRVLPPSQRDKVRQAEQKKRNQDLSEAAYLDFSITRPYMFEGETMEGQVSLNIWNRLPVTRIDRIPTKTGDGFSITELGQPVEKRNVPMNGKNYNSYNWKFGITAALPGIQSISFSSVLRVRVKQNRNSPLGNPFFSDPFFGFGSEEGLEVGSDPLTVEVRSLPTDSRPKGFAGAIGIFTLASAIDKDRVSLGDPVRLTCKIKGKGNFSAMPAPPVSLGEDFKVGPPAFSFDGSTSTLHQGVQSFEYVITPLRPGLLEIPPIPFSFFNPDNEVYTSLTFSPHPLRVDPGEKWMEPSSVEVSQSDEKSTSSANNMFQTESEPGEWVSSISIEDPLSSKMFWGAQAFGLLLFLSVLFFRLKNRNPLMEELKLKDRVLSNKLRETVKHKDRAGFYKSLRRRIRLRASMVCPGANPSALSNKELLALLKARGYSQNLLDEISKLLQICEDHEYAGGVKNTDSLESELSRSQSIIRKLK